jgi:Fasciclin domain
MAPEFCDPRTSRWACRATVYKSSTCKGFVGYGDADPSNVDPLVHGAEMRVAETRAVNRALRKAYAVPLCSVEVGSFDEPPETSRESKKVPPETSNGNGNNGGPKVRDRLCQLIRQHQLDPNPRSCSPSRESATWLLQWCDVTAEQVMKLSSAKTVNGQDLKITVNDGTVMVNDAKVVKADVLPSNGVIHVIDTVLLPKD